MCLFEVSKSAGAYEHVIFFLPGKLQGSPKTRESRTYTYMGLSSTGGTPQN